LDKWKASEKTHAVVKDLIGNHHPHLADICDDIVVIFREKAPKKGGRPVRGKTSKAPAILSLLGERAYQFVLEIGFDYWNVMTDVQQKALLDHLLCFIGGEENEQTAEMKYFMQEPDIYYFTEEVDRNGHWRQELADLLSEVDEDDETSASPAFSVLGDTDD